MNLEQLKTEHPDLVASLYAEGSAKEKQRLKDILSCEAAEGREKLAQEIALNTEINAMDAQHLMKSAPKDEPEKPQSSSFDRVMSSIPNPEIAPDGDDHIVNADTVADRIASTR